MYRRIVTGIFTLMLVVLSSSAVHAADAALTDRVSFQVEAGREIENNLVSALLHAQAEGRDAAELADEINQTMHWALQQSKAVQAITAQTGNYRTHPVYDDRKIVRWRGVQELRLESQNVAALSELLGVLQARLQMQSMQFSVSPAARDRVEAELIAEALTAFRARASLIADSLKASDYELLDININNAGGPPPMPMHMERSVMRASAATVAPPSVEQGNSRIGVQVNGSIRLLRK